MTTRLPDLSLAFFQDDVDVTFAALADSALLPKSPPTDLTLDNRFRQPIGEDWRARVLRCKSYGAAIWHAEQAEAYVPKVARSPRHGTTKVIIPDYDLNWFELVNELIRIPFTVCSAAEQFNHLWSELPYQRAGWGMGHCLLGFLCAFKGEAGHSHLGSRRFLTHGPWRLIRIEENDLSIVLFHDFALLDQPAAALAQAQPGILLLGNTEQSGYISQEKEYYYEGVTGNYLAHTRSHHVVLAKEPASLTRMHDALTYKWWRRNDPKFPVDSVAFFWTMSEEQARAHLHDLWIRGLECWAFGPNGEVRLHEGYDPPVRKPQWVLDWEEREPDLGAVYTG